MGQVGQAIASDLVRLSPEHEQPCEAAEADGRVDQGGPHPRRREGREGKGRREREEAEPEVSRPLKIKWRVVTAQDRRHS